MTAIPSDHLVRMIRNRIAATPKAPAMRFKVAAKWQTITFEELGRSIDAVASWLIDANVQVGDRVAIFAPNSPSWTIADIASQAVGAIPVPVYATNTAAQVAHIVADAGARVVFVGGADHYAKLASSRRPQGSVERVIVFDENLPLDGSDSCHMSTPLKHPVSPVLQARAARYNIHDVATIIYTSGTTGEPKGVMLTFENLVSQFEAVDAFFSVTPADRSLAFLPLSHSYERTWTYYILLKGAQNFYLEDPKAVVETLADVRPTCMVSVPRLYEKVYSTARHKVQQGSERKQKLFDWAIRVGRRVAYARKNGERISPALKAQHVLADRLVLHKVRDIVGGLKNFFSAGGAALSSEIEEFFFAAGLLVCQGYGLTETAPMCTCNRPNDFRFGTVGKAIPGCEMKIAADGEILVRGRNVMVGYFGKPDETKAAFEDGWFKTGDIGAIDPDGFVRITDRKKDLIITSGGKNIAPSRIESVIGQDYYIEQVAAVGDGRHYLSALVVPHFDALEQWAREHGVTYDSLRAMVKDHRVIKFMAERIEQRQKELAQHERVKKFTLLGERFSQMGGELTPTLKNIRAAIHAKYEHLIAAMYEDHHKDPHKDPVDRQH